MNQIQNRVDDSLDALRTKITMRRVIGITFYIIILALVGLFQAIAMDFDFSIYTTWDYYFRVVYRVILIILAYISTINILYDKAISSPKVQNPKKRYLELAKLKDEDFPQYIDGYNRRTKIEYYTNSIMNKINKLEKKLEKITNPKRKQKLLNKISNFKVMISTEYIEEHIDYIFIKYPKVYPSDFSSVDIENTGVSEHKTRGNFDGKVAKWSIKKLISYILITLLFGSIAINAATTDNTAEFWISILTDIGLVLMRIVSAYINMPIIIDSEFTCVYLNKIEILKDYINHKEEKVESKSNKILKYLEKIENESNNITEDNK